MAVKVKLRKGDRVRVLQGKDRGQTGEVMKVLPKANRVIVDGVNRVKKHQKATKSTMQGGIIDKDMPISIAAVALVCGDCGRTRIGFKIEENGHKVRICKKCGGQV